MPARLNIGLALAQRGAKRYGSQIRMPCPLHGGTDALSISTDDPVMWHCFAGCDGRAVGSALREAGIVTMESNGAQFRERPAERTAARDAQKKLEWCRRVWSETVPLSEDRGLPYFRSRGISDDLIRRVGPTVLRWRIGSPAEIVARVTDAQGRGTALHRTIFWADRSRVERRANGALRGGAIRLLDPEHDRIVIAEGLETALSYYELHREVRDWRVWSLISAGGIERFVPPPWCTWLTVACDFDGAGITAWERLDRRLTIPCELRLPGGEAHYGCDWNDVARHEWQSTTTT